MANEPIPAHCDSGCQKNFSITKFRKRKVKHGIEKHFFRCPHCKHEYVNYYASPETIKLQKEMRRFHRDAFALGSTMTPDEINTREYELRIQIKASMDQARALVEASE